MLGRINVAQTLLSVLVRLGRINVAQTLLSVLVMLGSIEQINVC
jgi:hypothetical protein